MPKPRSIKELLRTSNERLSTLTARVAERSLTLEHVCKALPAPLAKSVVSAGLERGRLTVGVAGAAWAARLRYETLRLRTRVGASMAADILSVRIKVVPPRA